MGESGEGGRGGELKGWVVIRMNRLQVNEDISGWPDKRQLDGFIDDALNGSAE